MHDPITRVPLLRFYTKIIGGRDHRGRSLQDILQWQNSQLESCHNYIQIMFPLPEGSLFNNAAPVVDRTIFYAFRDSGAPPGALITRTMLQDRLLQSFSRILNFYGYTLLTVDGNEGVRILPAYDYQEATSRWTVNFDHNHLRITRILRSLRVLGLGREAEAFLEKLLHTNETSGKRISQRTLTYWARATKRPLYIAPDVDQYVEGSGKDFLIEFENKNLHDWRDGKRWVDRTYQGIRMPTTAGGS